MDRVIRRQDTGLPLQGPFHKCLMATILMAMPAQRSPRDRPTASSRSVSAFMSRQRTVDTGPEMAVRRELHRRGLRFRVNVGNLPGRPDIVFTKARIAVQIDGCFWHGCPDHGVAPKANADWWKAKLRANRERDTRNDHLLTEDGWLVIRAWEHQPPAEVADKVEREWMARTGRSP